MPGSARDAAAPFTLRGGFLMGYQPVTNWFLTGFQSNLRNIPAYQVETLGISCCSETSFCSVSVQFPMHSIISFLGSCIRNNVCADLLLTLPRKPRSNTGRQTRTVWWICPNGLFHVQRGCQVPSRRSASTMYPHPGMVCCSSQRSKECFDGVAHRYQQCNTGR